MFFQIKAERGVDWKSPAPKRKLHCPHYGRRKEKTVKKDEGRNFYQVANGGSSGGTNFLGEGGKVVNGEGSRENQV